MPTLAGGYVLFFGMSLCFACSLHRDFGQGYAGGYAQVFGNAHKPIDPLLVIYSLPCCFLLIVYEDIFPPEAMKLKLFSVPPTSYYLTVASL